LFRFPSSVREHEPGFVYVLDVPGFLTVTALGLCMAPWAVSRDAHPRRVAVALAALWTAGLITFGVATRGALLWWLVSLPLVAAVLSRVPAPSRSLAGRAIRVLPFVVVAVLAALGARDTVVTRPWEGTVSRRTLVAPAGWTAMLLADTLDRLAPGGSGRVLTTFDYGNALLWRLPRYSMSIDGRTIFPDSAALMDAWVIASRVRDSTPTVAGSAELAMLPVGHAAERRLAASPEWRRLAVVARPAPGARPDSGALWARTRWIDAHRPTAALPRP
jgi:hypothetical protein